MPQPDGTMVVDRNPRMSMSAFQQQQQSNQSSQQMQSQNSQHNPPPTQNHTNSMERHLGSQQQQQSQTAQSEYSNSSINSRDPATNMQQQPQNQQSQRQQTNAPPPPDPGGIIICDMAYSNPKYIKKIRLDESAATHSSVSQQQDPQQQTHLPLLQIHHSSLQPIHRNTPPSQQSQQHSSQPSQNPSSVPSQTQQQIQAAVSTNSSSSIPSSTITSSSNSAGGVQTITTSSPATNSNSQQSSSTNNPPSGVSSLPPSTALKIDVVNTQPSGSYHPQVEAISPEPRPTKDELLLQICKVDIEIEKTTRNIRDMKEKARLLEVASAQKSTNPDSEEKPEQPAEKHRNLAQQIYSENRKRAETAHVLLNSLNATLDGKTFQLPLYNQPQDTEACKQIQQKHIVFKSSLILYLKKLKLERSKEQQEISDRYAKSQQTWSNRVQRIENSLKRKIKEAKNREFFEKVFPELRKQREDKERFNRVGSRVKSEADIEEVIDGLQEQVRSS